MSRKNKEEIISPEQPFNADKHPLGEYHTVGKRGLQRKDGYEKATGYALYTADVNLPGQLWLRILCVV